MTSSGLIDPSSHLHSEEPTHNMTVHKDQRIRRNGTKQVNGFYVCSLL